MKIFAAIIVLMVTATIAMWGVVIYNPTPPLVFDRPADIFPNVLRAGDDFHVTRRFTVLRPVNINITRTLVHGDCSKACEVVDLTHGESLLEKGDYVRTRTHTVPLSVKPGEWSFENRYTYTDEIGREHSHRMPSMKLTIVR